MRLTGLAALAAMGVFLSGCASIISGTTENVTVNTPPTTGATCSLANGEGNWSVVSPGTANVTRSGHDLAVHCSKAGFGEGATSVASGIEPWVFGNILLGGVIGIVVDLATGAVHKYPHHVDVPMQPAAPPPPAAPAPGSPQTS